MSYFIISSVLMLVDGKQQLIYKQAISTIMK
ncbi:RNA chaperone Hfq [Bacillus sp. BF9-10]